MVDRCLRVISAEKAKAAGSNPARSTLKITSEGVGCDCGIQTVKSKEGFTRFLVVFNDVCDRISEDRLKRLMKVVSLARKRRFRRGGNRPKYGNMNRAFTEYEIKRFFAVVKNPKHRLLFQYQAFMGLRVGEAVRMNVKDINIPTRELRIYAPKTNRLDYMLIPEKLFKDTLRYYETYEREIKEAGGYLFYKEGEMGHVDEGYMRNQFSEYREKAGLMETYTVSEESMKEPRKLYRLTTHSLRHYAITHFYNTTRDQQATKMFARHTKSSTTDTYIHKTKEEVYRAIDLAFG